MPASSGCETEWALGPGHARRAAQKLYKHARPLLPHITSNKQHTTTPGTLTSVSVCKKKSRLYQFITVRKAVQTFKFLKVKVTGYLTSGSLWELILINTPFNFNPELQNRLYSRCDDKADTWGKIHKETIKKVELIKNWPTNKVITYGLVSIRRKWNWEKL